VKGKETEGDRNVGVRGFKGRAQARDSVAATDGRIRSARHGCGAGQRRGGLRCEQQTGADGSCSARTDPSAFDPSRHRLFGGLKSFGLNGMFYLYVYIIKNATSSNGI
jgi:hypothetical protein